MNTTTHTDTNAADENLARLRRPPSKDTLLGDEPPKALSVAIAAIAVLLAAAVAAASLIEYQDTMPVTLTLKAGDSPGSAYAVCFLQQREAEKVKTGQAVLVDAGPGASAGRGVIEARVGEITAVGASALYSVRVDLPDNAAEVWRGSAPRADSQAQASGRIVARKVRLFDRLFGMFDALSDGS